MMRCRFAIRFDTTFGETEAKISEMNQTVKIRASIVECKRPTNPALAVHCRAWEVCSVIGKLVSTHDDGYGFGWQGAPAAMDDL